MRLFFAVNFDGKTKNELMSDISALRDLSLEGSFTRRENLHITLAFIGELDRARLGDAIAAAGAIRLARFDFTVGGAGSFGDLIWLGVKEGEAELRRLSSAVTAECRARNIGTDPKPFSPHLTIARRTVMKPGCTLSAFSKSIKPIPIPADSLELMESIRINGVLQYRTVYSKQLQKEE